MVAKKDVLKFKVFGFNLTAGKPTGSLSGGYRTDIQHECRGIDTKNMHTRRDFHQLFQPGKGYRSLPYSRQVKYHLESFFVQLQQLKPGAWMKEESGRKKALPQKMETFMNPR